MFASASASAGDKPKRIQDLGFLLSRRLNRALNGNPA